MTRTAALLSLILLLPGATALGDNSRLLTYGEFLSSRGLTEDDVEPVKCQSEGVLNTWTQSWDRGQEVCQVWTKEKVIPKKVIPEKVIPEKVTPAEPLKFSDGSQVYMTVRRWQETTQVPKEVERSERYVVREDTKEETKKTRTSFKRYIVKDQ